MDNMSHGQVYLGQAGWDDTDELFFPGTSEDDGHTLVRCQLFTGRDITKPHDPDRAQGTKLVCHVADGVFKVPVKGASVYIIIPHGMEGVAGSGLIIASVGGGQEVNKNITPGDLIIQPPGGGQACIVMKEEKGSTTICTTDDNTKDGGVVFLRVSPTALQFIAPWGRLVFDPTGFHVSTAAGPRFDMGAIKIPGLSDVPGVGDLINAFSSYATISASAVNVKGASVFLGAGPLFNPTVHAPIKTVPPLPLPPIQVTDFTDLKQSQSVYIAA